MTIKIRTITYVHILFLMNFIRHCELDEEGDGKVPILYCEA